MSASSTSSLQDGRFFSAMISAGSLTVRTQEAVDTYPLSSLVQIQMSVDEKAREEKKNLRRAVAQAKYNLPVFVGLCGVFLLGYLFSPHKSNVPTWTFWGLPIGLLFERLSTSHNRKRLAELEAQGYILRVSKAGGAIKSYPFSDANLDESTVEAFVAVVGATITSARVEADLSGDSQSKTSASGHPSVVSPKEFSQLGEAGLATIRNAKERVNIRCLECGYSGEAGVVAGSHQRNWLQLMWIAPVALVLGLVANVTFVGGFSAYSPYGPPSDGEAAVWVLIWAVLSFLIGSLIATVGMPVKRLVLCPACRQNIGPV